MSKYKQWMEVGLGSSNPNPKLSLRPDRQGKLLLQERFQSQAAAGSCHTWLRMCTTESKHPVPRDHSDWAYSGHLLASTCFVGHSLGLAPHEMVIALDYLWVCGLRV